MKNNNMKKNIIGEISKCENCDKEVLNPIKFDNDIIVCETCVQQYIFCCENGCKVIQKYSKIWKKSCRSCYAWFCDKHNNTSSCCN